MIKKDTNIRFYFKNTEDYKLQFTEPTSSELRNVKTIIRWTKVNHGTVIESDRDVELFFTVENNNELYKRESLYNE